MTRGGPAIGPRPKGAESGAEGVPLDQDGRPYLELPAAGVHPTRHRLGVWIEGRGPRNFITALIIVNAVILGLQTSEGLNEAIGGVLTLLNGLILAVFVVEITIKLIAGGWGFFRSGWNVFDFFVVAVSMIPGGGPLQILRSLRVLRVLRLLSQVRRLRDIVESLLRALPGLGWTALLLALVFYVFAVIGTELFAEEYPAFFGSLGGSLLSLFQIMTLESWSSDIARPVLETYPWAWLYFVPFILIASFMVLNLFIAIIVSATPSWHADEDELKRREMAEEMRLMREQLELVSAMVERLSDGPAKPTETQEAG